MRYFTWKLELFQIFYDWLSLETPFLILTYLRPSEINFSDNLGKSKTFYTVLT